MNKILLAAGAALLAALPSEAQMERSIKLNEVQTVNGGGLQDEYGHCGPWVEIANVSHSTYNIRGMFVTTDRRALDKSLSAPERMKLMAPIPSGDERTNMSARQHTVYFLGSNPALGAAHLAVPVEGDKPVWVGLYNGNGVDLVDSVTVPPLKDGQSYARAKDGAAEWQVKPAEAVTPGIGNYINVSETKVAKVKREDPYGIGITVISMGIVFFCLALLFVFFELLGLFLRHRETAKKVASIAPVKVGVKTVEKTMEVGRVASNILQDGLKTKGRDKEIYIAVIAMALKQYQDDVHDVESGIITIRPKHTDWNGEYMQMTQFHE